jgi:integrase/recombinase XerC
MPTPGHRSQRIPRYLTQAELRAFFAVVGDVRDRALFTIVYHYGLRVSEVALLERGDVDLDRGRIVVKRVKNGFWMERPLFPGTARVLAPYLAEHPGDGVRALFPGRAGPLRKRQIQARFARYRAEAGLPAHYTPHSLRHSIATHLLDAGASLEFVQDHLGHRDIGSTTIYARITDRHREAVFRQLEASPWIVHPATKPTSAPREEVPECASEHSQLALPWP